MKFFVEIETENAAFEDNGLSNEIARILRQAANNVDAGKLSNALYDENGNRVGGHRYDPE